MLSPVSFFQPDQPFVSASANGSLEILGGGAADFGSLVLQMPLDEKVTVMASFRPDNWLRIYSTKIRDSFALNLEPFRRMYATMDIYPVAKRTIRLQKNGQWAAHVAGCIFTLCFENRLPIIGMDIYVDSEIPIKKGGASSSALSVATLRAMEKLMGITLHGTHLPNLVQKSENYIVVGSSGNIANALCSYAGAKGQILPIVCQPDKILDTVNLNKGKIHFYALQSGKPPHNKDLTNTFEDRKVAAFMGYSIIAQMEGQNPKALRGLRYGTGRDNLPFNGYLCNINQAVFTEKYEKNIPEIVNGSDFLKNFGETIDYTSAVDPKKNYKVRQSTAYPIFENYRSRAFYALLLATVHEALEVDEDFKNRHLSRLGNWLYESNQNNMECGIGNSKTQKIVELAKEFGAKNDIFGAKIVGNGKNGLVCIMAYGDKGQQAVHEIHHQFQKWSGEKTALFEPNYPKHVTTE